MDRKRRFNERKTTLCSMYMAKTDNNIAYFFLLWCRCSYSCNSILGSSTNQPAGMEGVPKTTTPDYCFVALSQTVRIRTSKSHGAGLGFATIARTNDRRSQHDLRRRWKPSRPDRGTTRRKRRRRPIHPKPRTFRFPFIPLFAFFFFFMFSSTI